MEWRVRLIFMYMRNNSRLLLREEEQIYLKNNNHDNF